MQLHRSSVINNTQRRNALDSLQHNKQESKPEPQAQENKPEPQPQENTFALENLRKRRRNKKKKKTTEAEICRIAKKCYKWTETSSQRKKICFRIKISGQAIM